ncbi:MAG: alpha/beta hydrolase [Verrucomicrobiota bacterium]
MRRLCRAIRDGSSTGFLFHSPLVCVPAWALLVFCMMSMQEAFVGSAQVKLGKPSPTVSNLRYGPEKRNVLDLWVPEVNAPVPLVLYFHGGGFKQGNKSMISGKEIREALNRGTAIASVQYQFVHREDLSDRERAGVDSVMRGSARAVQFLRHHAEEYGIDPERVACYGESAGSGISFWIAAHDDLADSHSNDPVARQSTRISAVALTNGQYTYDISKWLPEFSSRFGSGLKNFDTINHAAFFGLSDDAYEGPEGAKRRANADMISFLSPDDPPMLMVTPAASRRPISIVGFSHHPLHVELVEARCREVGVEIKTLLPKVRPEDAVYLKQNPLPALRFVLDRVAKPAGSTEEDPDRPAGGSVSGTIEASSPSN